MLIDDDVLWYDHDRLEVIVMDDASTDDTYNTVQVKIRIVCNDPPTYLPTYLSTYRPWQRWIPG